MLIAGLALLAAGCTGPADQLAPDAVDLTSSAYTLVPVASVSVDPGSATVKIGAPVQLTTNILSSNGQRVVEPAANVRWASSDTSVAVVSSRGVVTGRRRGTAKIIATVGYRSGTGTISVAADSIATPPPAVVGGGAATNKAAVSSNTTQPQQQTSQGQSLSGKQFLGDDFRSYSGTAQLLANISRNIGGTGDPSQATYTDGGGTDLISLDSTVTYNGHPTMKYTQPASSQRSPSLEAKFRNPASLQNMWFRVKVRFSPGFSTTGTIANSANAYKLIGFGWVHANGRGTIEITNTTQYQLYWYTLGTGGSTLAGGVFADAGHISSEWTDGAWYDYIIQYVQTSPTSAISRMWMARDGSTPVFKAASTGTGSAQDMDSIDRVILGSHFNQMRTSTQAQAVWIGQWEVVDGSHFDNPFNVQMP